MSLHLFGITAKQDDRVGVISNLLDQMSLIDNLDDFEPSKVSLYLFAHFEQVIIVFFFFIQIEKHFLWTIGQSGRGNQSVQIDFIDDFEHVLKENHFNVVTLHGNFCLFGKDVLIFIAKTENCHLFLLFSFESQVLNPA
jgi:hypothetical protein